MINPGKSFAEIQHNVNVYAKSNVFWLWQNEQILANYAPVNPNSIKLIDVDPNRNIFWDRQLDLKECVLPWRRQVSFVSESNYSWIDQVIDYSVIIQLNDVGLQYKHIFQPKYIKWFYKNMCLL